MEKERLKLEKECCPESDLYGIVYFSDTREHECLNRCYGRHFLPDFFEENDTTRIADLVNKISEALFTHDIESKKYELTW